MDNLLIVYDEKLLMLEPPFYHPENSKRLTSIIDYLESKNFFDDVNIVSPEMASEKQILKVHSEEHLFLVRDSILEGEKFLDAGDTFIVKDSWVAALLAAGSGIKAVDLAAGKSAKNIFCLIRPPGHHSGIYAPKGFCLFNNLAVAAGYAADTYGLKRTAIIDWDVHHGNGTQEIFWYSNEVLYISIHQYPFYPGTGSEDERGEGQGFGYTLNFPLPARTYGNRYLQIFDENILNELKKYNPELILISAGFDAHKNDPLADMNLESSDYYILSVRVRDYAETNDVPVISFLEGGYNLEALSESVYEHLSALKL